MLTYAPGIKSMSWAVTHERITEAPAAGEGRFQKRADKKRKVAKTEPGSSQEGELDLPASAPAEKKTKHDVKEDKKELQRLAQEAKRNVRENLKKAGCAALCCWPPRQAWRSCWRSCRWPNCSQSSATLFKASRRG